MKILLFVHQREDYFKYRKEFKAFLEKQGHLVYVLMPSKDVNSSFNVVSDDEFNYLEYHYSRTYLAVFDIVRNYFEFCKLIKNFDIDLIISYKFYPNLVTGIYRFSNNSVKTLSVVAGRGRFSNSSNIIENWIFKIYTRVLGRGDGIIVQNNEDSIFFKDKLKCSKVFKVNGSGAFLDEDIQKFKSLTQNELIAFKNDNKLPTSGKVIFLFSSRIVEEKGIFELIAAFKSDKLNRIAHLCIAGWFDTKYIKSSVLDSIRNSSNITYIGNHKNVILPMAISEFVVLPTRYGEGVPRSLIEALAFRKPIISSNVAGCSEIVEDGLNGYFVDPCDVNDIVNKINSMCFLTDSKKNTMASHSFKVFKEKYDYRIVFNQFLDVINEVTSKSIY
jgi:glycosyltransferase involved in cell wall biosynthesis